MLAVGHFGQETEGSAANDLTEWNCILCDITISVCWQAWRDITEEFAVTINNVCHDVGLRKQPLGYHNSCDCCYVYFTLLVWFWLLQCGDVVSAY